MQRILNILFLLIPALFFESCNSGEVSRARAKTLDSLTGVLSTMVHELSITDTISLNKAISKFENYRQFILQNIKDTLAKNEADHLQDFYRSGKSLENFSVNRKNILARTALINTQLLKLRKDLINDNADPETLGINLIYEKKEAGKLVESAYTQRNILHTSLETFRNSIKAIEQLIMLRNKGQLPFVIQDSIPF